MQHVAYMCKRNVTLNPARCSCSTDRLGPIEFQAVFSVSRCGNVGPRFLSTVTRLIRVAAGWRRCRPHGRRWGAGAGACVARARQGAANAQLETRSLTGACIGWWQARRCLTTAPPCCTAAHAAMHAGLQPEQGRLRCQAQRHLSRQACAARAHLRQQGRAALRVVRVRLLQVVQVGGIGQGHVAVMSLSCATARRGTPT